MRINKDIAAEYLWQGGWKTRNRIVAAAVPPGAFVLDLGGGMGNLYALVKRKCAGYASIDLRPWTDATVVGDFNKGEFPDVGRADCFIVAQGIVEYVSDPEGFFKAVRKYGTTMVFTHREGGRNDEKPRHDRKHGEILAALARAGWEAVFKRGVWRRSQLVFYCVKKMES